ncbi:hypothetical protein F2P56_027676, partial [Juglans regia]
MAARPVDDTDGAHQNPVFFPQPLTVIRTVTSTGARISTQIKAEEMTFDEFLKATNTKVIFYIHHSIFTKDDASSWRLDAPYNIDSTLHPLLSLFKLLKIKPYLKAEFTPEELHSRKRVLNLDDDSEEAASMLPIVKRRKGCQQYPEQSKDEQALSESSVNKLVGAAEMYNLEEMEPPYTLMCDLRPYQKQALYWMSELEKGIHAEKAAKTLHPCWAAYQISD